MFSFPAWFYQWKKQTICVIQFTVLIWCTFGHRKCFNQTHCVNYFTNIHFVCLAVLPMNKSDTMCWAYIYSTCKYSCHDWCSVYWFLIHCIINHLSSIWYHYMGGLVLACCIIPGPGSLIHFLRYIYQKLELMCSYIDTDLLMTKYLFSMFLLINRKLKCLYIFMFHEMNSDSRIFFKL